MGGGKLIPVPSQRPPQTNLPPPHIRCLHADMAEQVLTLVAEVLSKPFEISDREDFLESQRCLARLACASRALNGAIRGSHARAVVYVVEYEDGVKNEFLGDLPRVLRQVRTLPRLEYVNVDLNNSGEGYNDGDFREIRELWRAILERAPEIRYLVFECQEFGPVRLMQALLAFSRSPSAFVQLVKFNLYSVDFMRVLRNLSPFHDLHKTRGNPPFRVPAGVRFELYLDLPGVDGDYVVSMLDEMHTRDEEEREWVRDFIGAFRFCDEADPHDHTPGEEEEWSRLLPEDTELDEYLGGKTPGI